MDEASIDKAVADAVKHRGDLFSLMDEIDDMEKSEIKDRLYQLCTHAKEQADGLLQLQRKAIGFKEY
jgi:hypothetical protein